MNESTITIDQAEKLRRLVSRATAQPRCVDESRDIFNVPLSVGPSMSQERTQPRRLARAIAISSGKGGVGKTNLAVNLAVNFARRGLRTVLLDADLGLANADVLCGITPRSTLEDVVTGECTLDEVMVTAPGGFRLLPGASGVSRLADMGQIQRRNVLEQLMHLEQSVDVLIVDTGAGIGANSMAVAAASHSILITCTPEPTAIADAYGAIKTLSARGCRAGMQLVVNMVLNDEEGKAVHARVDRVARAFLGVKIGYAGAIPHDSAVPAAVRRREPVSIGAPNAPASKAIRQLAYTLSGAGSDASPMMELADQPVHAKSFLARLTNFLVTR